MKKRYLLLLAVLVVFGGGARIAGAHECTYTGDQPDTGDQTECHESPVAPNWRDGNYVPVFDITDRSDENQRKNAQRWREECQGTSDDGAYHSDQMCAWARGGYSHTPGTYGETAPNEAHAGFAASHCFLGEFAHQCEGHDSRHGEAVHDKHGGALYADVCLMPNTESKYCNDGPTDTQAGVTVMDHNPCGLIVPIVACIDEYHVVRPLDQDYTTEQMEDSQEYIPRILADPVLYLCGYEEYRDGLPVCDAGAGLFDGVRFAIASGAVHLTEAQVAQATAARAVAASVAGHELDAEVLGLRTPGRSAAGSSTLAAWLVLALAIVVRGRRAIALRA